jgi:hypothetical protein
MMRATHQRLDGHQLDQDVVGRSRCVLQRVTDCVADDGSMVALRALSAQRARVLTSTGLVKMQKCERSVE